LQIGNNHISKKYYSLLELTKSIESVVKKTYSSSYWVKAEIAKLNYYPKSGHCYPDLVEKENGVVLAQIRGTIWAGQFTDINRKFMSVTKEALSDGMTVLIRTTVTFHPVYGLSVQIIDIEPSFTLGELAKEKQESIDRLIKDGIFHSNKQLIPSLLLQRLAVISVETSKGYHDFINVIDNNSWGYKFFHMLFPALLQGAGAITSITEQLTRINKVIDHFDAVLIIRGGGGDVGLSSFDNYNLAKAVAEFPLPVITGIGHATNETVVEQVSYINKITPTEVGYYLLQGYHNFSVRIENAQKTIGEKAGQISMIENMRLGKLVSSIKSITDSILFENRSNIADAKNRLSQSVKSNFDAEFQKIQLSELVLKNQSVNLLTTAGFQLSSLTDKVRLLEPENILKRGYSITTHKGKALVNSKNLKLGDEIETITYDSRIKSKVYDIENTQGNE